MSTANCSFLITILVLGISLSFSTILALEDYKKGSVTSTVHVINGLPKKSDSVNVHCNSKYTDLGMYTLNEGEEYKWVAEKQAEYFCEAIWGPRFFASWHAFQPKRDLVHSGGASVFWLVKKDGFFLSWDNSTWVKKSTWETE